MGFIQVAMIILAIIAAIVGFCNIDNAINDRHNGRTNLMIAALMCLLMGIGANTISEAGHAFSQLKQQNSALQTKVESTQYRLEKALNETIVLTKNVQKFQNAYEKEQRAKAELDAQLNTTTQELKVATDKLTKIQKLVEAK